MHLDFDLVLNDRGEPLEMYSLYHLGLGGAGKPQVGAAYHAALALCAMIFRPSRMVWPDPYLMVSTMKTIRVFDPALCCSTGVCGVDVDQSLVSFSADVAWANAEGGHIERFNLAQQPMAFAEDPIVKSFLERSGHEALPLILVDGEVAMVGRYPNRAELAR